MAITNDGPRKIQVIFADRGVHIAPMTAKTIDAILGRERIVLVREIVDHLYGHMPNGGPDWADGCVRRYVYRARLAIVQAGLPWRIEATRQRGYRLLYLQVEDDARLAA